MDLFTSTKNTRASLLSFATARRHLRLFLTERNLDRAIEENDVEVVSIFIDYDIRMCYNKDLEHMREELGKKYTQRNGVRACYNNDLEEIRTIFANAPTSSTEERICISILKDYNDIELLAVCKQITMFAEMLFSSNADTEFTKENHYTNLMSLIGG